MRKIAGIACAAMLLSACSTSPQRPPTGPGSGSGASYVPMVEPVLPANVTSGPSFDALVAKCQREATGLPFIKTEDHDAAIAVVAAGAGFAIGWNLAIMSGNDASFAYPAGLALTPPFLGIVYLFSKWVYSPQTKAWHQKQETQVANCMARYGYKNLDPSVLVTWKMVSTSTISTRATGRDTFSAEKLAKSMNCAAVPSATLVAKGPGFEDHRVACTNGPDLGIHCEFGQCRVASGFATN